MKRNVKYQSNYSSSTSQKVDWLLKHQTMWEGLKLPDEFHRVEKIVKKMKEEGLYSKTTYIKDIWTSVIRLINVARVFRRNENADTNTSPTTMAQDSGHSRELPSDEGTEVS